MCINEHVLGWPRLAVIHTIQLEKWKMHFHDEIWYECYATGGRPKIILFNFLEPGLAMTDDKKPSTNIQLQHTNSL
jgi:hypothetical protein